MELSGLGVSWNPAISIFLPSDSDGLANGQHSSAFCLLPHRPPLSKVAPSVRKHGCYRSSSRGSQDPVGALDSVLSEWGMVVKTREAVPQNHNH